MNTVEIAMNDAGRGMKKGLYHLCDTIPFTSYPSKITPLLP